MVIEFSGDRLSQLRKTAGLSQEHLGRRIGLTPGNAQRTVSVWERGVKIPHVNTLPLLADALDCGIKDFFAPALDIHAVADPPTAISA